MVNKKKGEINFSSKNFKLLAKKKKKKKKRVEKK